MTITATSIQVNNSGIVTTVSLDDVLLELSASNFVSATNRVSRKLLWSGALGGVTVPGATTDTEKINYFRNVLFS